MTPTQTPADAVTVGYIHSNDVAYSWHRSLVELIGYDLANHQRVLRGGWIGVKTGTGGIVEGRNEVVAKFLSDDTADWLLWIDTDMGFPADAADALLEAADPVDRPIVGGLCFASKEVGPDGLGGAYTAPRPTIFDFVTVDGKSGFKGRTTYPVNDVVQCAGTGAACILIHRSVLERIRDRFGETWYNRLAGHDGAPIGEDLSFCMRAGMLNIPIFVDTSVKTSHAKTTWVQEQDYWRHVTAPPATDPVAVIVPAMRPECAAPFMQSLRASTGLAAVYAVCHYQDDVLAETWRAAGAEHVITTGVETTFAAKANAGYAFTSEPWLFLVGEDVRFHPGWLDHAQATAAHQQAAVVGTNDLATERVVDGRHATHLLISRAYAAEVGASWDGPGTIAHDGYRHWFVDDEIVTAAKSRGVWAMALASVVEHLHPIAGTAPDDDVYAAGRAHATEDQALFLARLKEHAS